MSTQAVAASQFGQPFQSAPHSCLGAAEAAAHRLGDFVKLQLTKKSKPQRVSFQLGNLIEQIGERLASLCP